jgi:hypothetical protein
MSERATATRRIAAPASAIFDIVSSAQGHVDIDGSGMLMAAPNNEPIATAGDTFDIDMDRRPLGDIPNLAEYKVRNHVTEYEPDRLFEWRPAGIDMAPLGYRWGWQIEAVGDTECDVTNYCDWTEVPEETRKMLPGTWPIIPVHMLEQSVEKLERLVTRGGA